MIRRELGARVFWPRVLASTRMCLSKRCFHLFSAAAGNKRAVYYELLYGLSVRTTLYIIL